MSMTISLAKQWSLFKRLCPGGQKKSQSPEQKSELIVFCTSYNQNLDEMNELVKEHITSNKLNC